MWRVRITKDGDPKWYILEMTGCDVEYDDGIPDDDIVGSIKAEGDEGPSTPLKG